MDNSSRGYKTTNLYKQNPVLNGCHIESDSVDVLQSSFYKFPLGYNYGDWFNNKDIELKKGLSILRKLRRTSL